MSKLIDFESYPISPVLDRLLQDKTTKQNIIFATDAYLENGPDFAETAQITVDKLLGYMKIKIQPRVEKAAEEQLARTRKKAEVFTPSWIVNKMNNHCDEEWFDRPNVFNTETGTSWVTSSAPITFDGKLSWKGYVDSKRLEITCGEAPYIVSRYDAATGDIIPMFGDKIYATVEDGTLDTQIKSAFDDAAAKSQDAAQSAFDDFKEKFKSETVKSIIDIAKEKYQENIRVSDAKALEKGLNSQFDRAANKVYSSYQIEQNTAESDRLDALRSRHETGKSEAEIEAEFEQKKKELQDGLQEQLSDAVKSFIETSTQSVVETTEKKIKEREKAGIEDSVRDHLRGFSRTIPSFLMAYGDDTVTLATFDAVIPNPVFLEVTSITLDQFRFLRDGGKYTDAETGEERDFAGNLFDPVVFDDSVKEFLRLKKKLADYFDEKSIEDIFDYIPPQKTNQIFTPKTMVKKMGDMLEAENPGCFDDPDKTFIDLYMKSGLYITEIVKRLYQSEQMKKQFPDPKERLRHIFEKQVYGLAPTEIIYHIALSYILGFNEDTKDIKHNFRQLDALPYAKEGTLQQKLDELFS